MKKLPLVILLSLVVTACSTHKKVQKTDSSAINQVTTVIQADSIIKNRLTVVENHDTIHRHTTIVVEEYDSTGAVTRKATVNRDEHSGSKTNELQIDNEQLKSLKAEVDSLKSIINTKQEVNNDTDVKNPVVQTLQPIWWIVGVIGVILAIGILILIYLRYVKPKIK